MQFICELCRKNVWLGIRRLRKLLLRILGTNFFFLFSFFLFFFFSFFLFFFFSFFLFFFFSFFLFFFFSFWWGFFFVVVVVFFFTSFLFIQPGGSFPIPHPQKNLIYSFHIAEWSNNSMTCHHGWQSVL